MLAQRTLTPFAAAIVASSEHQDEARRFLDFLTAPQNAGVIRATGLVPAARPH